MFNFILKYYIHLNILTIGLAGLMGETNRVVKSVGPTPGSLANYITKRIQGEGKAIHSQNKYFSDTLNKIKNDLDSNDPVIALIAWSPMRMHYVNVVAVSDEDDIAILDTNNKFYYYTRSDYEELLDRRSYIPHNFCLDNYNLIRIYKT